MTAKMLVKPKAKAEENVVEAETVVTKAKKPAAPKAAVKAAVKAVEKAATAPKVETESEASEDLIVVVSKEVETMKEDKAIKMVPSLLDGIDQNYFKLGGVLSRVQAEGWYMDRGFESFRAYIETEVGMAYRKSMYLVQIYTGLVESGVKWEQVGHLGWTKLKELSSILTPDNVEDWVAVAESLTVLQLQDHIKAKKAEASGKAEAPSGEKSEVTTLTLKLHPDQKETIKAAIAKCKDETGTDVDAVAVEHICLDYLAGSKKVSAKKPSLADIMKGLSPEDVLTTFGEVFPEIGLTAEIPEDEDEDGETE